MAERNGLQVLTKSEMKNNSIPLSYVHNASNKKFSYSTVCDVLEKAAFDAPNTLAIISSQQGIRKTYRKLYEEVQLLSANLLDLGLKKGDRVALWGKNSYEWLLSAYALARNGLINVPICPAFKEQELKYSLECAQCKALIIQEDLDDTPYYDILCRIDGGIAHASSSELNLTELPLLKTILYISRTSSPKAGTISFYELLNKPRQMSNLTHSGVCSDDIFLLHYTSGTTGAPKASPITHFAATNDGKFIMERFTINEQVIMCLPLPLYHSFGSILTMSSALSRHCTVVLPSSKYNSKITLESIVSEKCNILLCVESMIIDITKLLQENVVDLSHLKIVSLGGSVCHPEIMTQVKELLGAKPLIGYGMTESSGAMAYGSYEDEYDFSHEGICGKVMDHGEVKIIDPNGIVPLGKLGEICYRGFNVFPGYWGNELQTNQILDEYRWLHTGDLGFFDDEYNLHIVSRLKDIIIRGGVNIYPTEVEDYVLRHPEVDEVAVVGIRDLKMGEEICACIVTKPNATLTTDDIRTFLKDKVSHFKIPKYCMFVDSLPKTVSGKIQRLLVTKTANGVFQVK